MCIHLWPIIFQEKKLTKQKKNVSDVNCSGHLNCHHFCILLRAKYYICLFAMCFFLSLNLRKEALSLARRSLLDNNGDKIRSSIFVFVYCITRFFHLKLFCKIVSV